MHDVCMCVCARMVEQNVADKVNQVSLELSHAALSLSGDHRLRVGRGRDSSRSSLLHRTRFAYACVSECWHVPCKKCSVGHDNQLNIDS